MTIMEKLDWCGQSDADADTGKMAPRLIANVFASDINDAAAIDMEALSE